MLADYPRSSVARVLPPATDPNTRKLTKVPFVELADGRMQGVVSSGSDLERVYVSSISAGDFAFTCSTNNNRPCGGAYNGFCKHAEAMFGAAFLAYGAKRIVRYLRMDIGEDETSDAIWGAMNNGLPHDDNSIAARVFGRFLRQLAYLELPPTTAPLPEMHWFATTRGAA